ncbi:MAG: YqeG family HAD IIIA-type phosphatase [Planctomycetes bacterium]|nr:YqeG family HAD IIIA-type phosphatase [Planctomycetota bacterium]
MLALITPHLRLETVLEIEASRLRALGLRGLLLDLDCTLKDYESAAVPPDVVDWIQTLRSREIRLCILSNGRTRRIEQVARTLELPFVGQAFKPLPCGCTLGLRKLKLRPEQAAVVGDQLFSDILAGKLSGLFTILVRPTDPREPYFTRLKRPLERWVLRRIERRARPPRSQPSGSRYRSILSFPFHSA